MLKTYAFFELANTDMPGFIALLLCFVSYELTEIKILKYCQRLLAKTKREVAFTLLGRLYLQIGPDTGSTVCSIFYVV